MRSHQAATSTRLRAFTIVELLVTLSIIGLLLVTILPSLSRFSRTNSLTLAGQTVREALAETQSDALASDPSVCLNMPVGKVINNYAFFVGSVTPTNNTAGAGGKYICGVGSLSPLVLQSNQYAILARANDAAGILQTIGVIRTGTLDSPAQFNAPIDNTSNAIALLSYDAPTGFFNSSLVTASNNVIPASGDTITSRSVKYTTQSSASGQYAAIGFLDPQEQVTFVVFVNATTGQITSSGTPPSGFQ